VVCITDGRLDGNASFGGRLQGAESQTAPQPDHPLHVHQVREEKTIAAGIVAADR